MISKELEAKILRLYHIEKWKIGTISTQLHVHHSAVRRVLAQSGAEEAVKMKRASMIEPFLPFVKQTLEGVGAWLRVKDRSPRPPSGAHATR